ncbi:protein of unknown function (plasmid) [Agrobacterium pusense]|uniref:Uncharacterized protein n=1 Tax=Agrobacterium pusense TaxID=648995 RepID=U4QI50_9HYPH|nr:protein of unknown function [Agrobacterium pusense]
MHRPLGVEGIMKTTTLIKLRGDAWRNPKKPKQCNSSTRPSRTCDPTAKRSSDNTMQWPTSWEYATSLQCISHSLELSLIRMHHGGPLSRGARTPNCQR